MVYGQTKTGVKEGRLHCATLCKTTAFSVVTGPSCVIPLLDCALSSFSPSLLGSSRLVTDEESEECSVRNFCSFRMVFHKVWLYTLQDWNA